MARIRSIHPDACASTTLAALDDFTERTWWRLLPHCDDHGRARDGDALKWKALLYPANLNVSPDQVEASLQKLEARRLVIRYVVDGVRCLQIRSWDEYQHPNKPTESKLPSPDADGAVTCTNASTSTELTYDSRSTPEPLRPGEEGRGGEKEGRGTHTRSTSSKRERVPPPGFLAWYENYPRKAARSDAEKAWTAVTNDGATPELLTDALEAWCTQWQAEGRPEDKLPYPATWLNKGHWRDTPTGRVNRPTTPVLGKSSAAYLEVAQEILGATTIRGQIA